MKNFLPIICGTPLFSGIAEDELQGMLACLSAKISHFPKGSYSLGEGDAVDSLELCKMRDEGLMEFHKNHFFLKL